MSKADKNFPPLLAAANFISLPVLYCFWRSVFHRRLCGQKLLWVESKLSSLPGSLAAIQAPGSGRAVLAWQSCGLPLPCLCRWKQPGLQILRDVLRDWVLFWGGSAEVRAV